MIVTTGAARLGRDAELRYTQNGDAVCNLHLAFTYGRKGEDGRRPTTWIEASLWGKRAEALQPYLLSGGQVVVALEDLHLESFVARDGGEKPKIVARVVDVDLVGEAPQQQAPAPQQARAPAPRQQPMPYQSNRAPVARPAPASTGGSGFDDMDSDIPF